MNDSKREQRESVYSDLFLKKTNRLKGQELENFLSKEAEILEVGDIDHYKNLKSPLNKYKRVHVNTSFVILFFGDDGTVYFVDYDHHDVIYKNATAALKKYARLKFF